jgi:ATP-binding cassette subfamily B protein
MVSFNTYISNLFSSISEVLGLNISKQKVMISLNRVDEIMSESSEEKIFSDNDFSLKDIDIEGKNIYFKYSEKDKLVLKNLSFKISSFGFYSFVGKNGCGKSTIAKLLVKLYDTDYGELNLNGDRYEDIEKENLRKNITYVQKEDFFFNDTILSNIKFANPNVSDKEVIDICKKINLDEYINTLSERYETIIGEGASIFSSGQKQKLSIARALLRNSKIYIFDEVTSNLDGKSEKLVVSIIKELSKNSVVFFISHKVSSIIESDEIFLIDGGVVAERGDHNYLIQNSKLYCELFRNIDYNIVEEMV